MVEAFLGIDIGGSHVGVGCISAEDGTVLCKSTAPIFEHTTFAALVDFVCETVSDMLDRANADNIAELVILSVGIGCPGQCKDGVLIGACIFPFRKVPLADAVSVRLSFFLGTTATIPCVLLNDADAAIAAEVWGNDSRKEFGSAKNIAMVTIGTGLGLGLVLDGRLYQGSRGLIEGGHMIIENNSHGRSCSCGQRGCVEAYSSAKNTSIRMFETDVAAERAKARDERARTTVDTCAVEFSEKILDNVTDDLETQYDTAAIEMVGAEKVFKRAAGGDKNALKILDETAEALSILCINICRILDPEFIIIGGGMSQAGDILLSLVHVNFRRRSWTILDDDVKIVLSRNSENAGIIGAALHASSCYYTIQDSLQEAVYKDGQASSPIPSMKKIKSKEILNFMQSNSSFQSLSGDANRVNNANNMNSLNDVSVDSNRPIDYNYNIFDSNNDNNYKNYLNIFDTPTTAPTTTPITKKTNKKMNNLTSNSNSNSDKEESVNYNNNVDNINTMNINNDKKKGSKRSPKGPEKEEKFPPNTTTPTLLYTSSAITIVSVTAVAYLLVSSKIGDKSLSEISGTEANVFVMIQSLAVVGHICATGYFFYLTRKDIL